MNKTYKGSCHCGKVLFEADIDLNEGKCKCNPGAASMIDRGWSGVEWLLTKDRWRDRMDTLQI
jgi:hypothetical protein